jgi:5-methylcytosine-specific restriction enzyme A
LKHSDNRESASKRGYNSQWYKARKAYLKEHCLCVECLKFGHITAANVVDHIKPHRGNNVLFWDMNNWQALCAPCHDQHKKRLEMSGKILGCTVTGVPVDTGHHWNQ